MIWKLGSMSLPDIVAFAISEDQDADLEKFTEEDGKEMPIEVLQAIVRGPAVLDETNTLLDVQRHVSRSSGSAVKAEAKAKANS